jgi:hypothetical protein
VVWSAQVEAVGACASAGVVVTGDADGEVRIWGISGQQEHNQQEETAPSTSANASEQRGRDGDSFIAPTWVCLARVEVSAR